MGTEWPALNSLVWLRLKCCDAEHPTRVEDFDGDYCVIGAPIAPHADAVPVRIAEGGFFIGWVGAQHAVEAPVDLIKAVDDPLPLWTISAIGDPIETQRRQFVRMAIQLPVQLYLIAGGAPTQAETIDISEGGIKCRVDEWAPDTGGRIFDLSLSLENRDFNLRGQIAWSGKQDAKGNRELGIQFVDIQPTVADSIRSQIFAAQLAERRKRLE